LIPYPNWILRTQENFSTMKYKVTLLPDAFLDIREIINWYNLEQRGLGKRFYDSLKLKIKSISHIPFSFQLSYKETRSAILDKFLYQIHYRVNELDRVIIIFAITHTSRNPRIWKEKS
jgi:plasmid stabilization system protein ParE